MNEFGNIEFYYPSWLLLVCIVLGIIYAFTLYYREDKFDDTSHWLVYLLGFMRGTAVAILASLLLIPVLSYFKTETETPTIIIAEDASESMKLSPSFDSTTYQASLNDLKDQLANDYKLVNWSFGDSIFTDRKSEFNRKETDISQVIEKAAETFKGRAVAGMVLSTDGMYNLGSNPVYRAGNLNFPIIPIAAGDTSKLMDASIVQVLSNKVAYLGDRFIIQADIAVEGAQGENVIISLDEISRSGSRNVGKMSTEINNSNFFTTKEFTVSANSAGVMHLRIQVSRLDGEQNTENNTRDIYIDVLDTRRKILIVGNAPHPDIGAIKTLMSENDKYEVDIAYPSSNKVAINDYNLVVFHNLPNNSSIADQLISNVQKQEIAQLYIIGRKTNLRKLSEVQNVLSINPRNQTNDVVAFYQDDFNLFELNDENANRYSAYPPVQSPFAEYKLKPGAQSLFSQKIGAVETQYPLYSFNEMDGARIGVFAAEGFWRWRLYEYLDTKSHSHIKNLLTKSIQYLSVKDDKRKFRAYPDEYLVNENEPVIFFAELYNDAFQPITDQDIEMEITDENGNEYTYRFSPQQQSYKADLGFMDPGEYQYNAFTSMNGNRLSNSGVFTVRPIQKEAANLVADHRLLYDLASRTGGKVYYPDKVSEIPEWIQDQKSSASVQYTSRMQSPLYSSWWIFGVISFLLFIEWFLRRYFGTY